MRKIPSSRAPTTSHLAAALVLAAVSSALVPACGDGDEVGMGSVGDGDGDASSGGGSSGAGGGGPVGGGTGQGGGGPEVDTCGGSPCSDHTGGRDFVEPGAPANAADLFGGATERPAGTELGREPAMLYPSHETMFPINVSRIRHEWVAGTGGSLFRLRFTGPKTTVDVYASGTSWEPGAEAWDWIAESNRGSEVRLEVSSIDPSSPADAWVSSPITLLFSRAEVEGAIYYWSTGTEGIMKALVSDPVPVKFYTDPTAPDGDQCVACHTLSRDGKRLAVGYGGEKLREVSVPDRSVILPTPPESGEETRSAWTTFSPDGTRLLVAADGKLRLIDSDTGAPVGDAEGVVPIPEGTVATHPDWSALGDKVAIALGTRGGNKDVEGGSIALLGYANGTWSAPEVIVQSTGATDNNFFPVWSPDSRWIAYVNASAKSKDAVSATLRLLEVATRRVVTLTRVNERVNADDGVTGIGNSMPTWAPSTRPGVFWLAFSSLRAYATVRPQDDKEDQIWIGAIDPALSPDPSYAAFWAPFQSIEDGNHRAFWTHTEGDKQCRCSDECGDGLDNDCDGTADESDCVTCGPVEICGDGLDNDCNCVVDECNEEICDDGIDNDGDGLIDIDDPRCRIR